MKSLREMQERISQMGLSACPVCASRQLHVLRLPVMQHIGGEHHEKDDPRRDPEANTLFLVQVQCNACGHVLLFNAEALLPGSERSLIVGLTDEEEAALEEES